MSDQNGGGVTGTSDLHGVLGVDGGTVVASLPSQRIGPLGPNDIPASASHGFSGALPCGGQGVLPRGGEINTPALVEAGSSLEVAAVAPAGTDAPRTSFLKDPKACAKNISRAEEDARPIKKRPIVEASPLELKETSPRRVQEKKAPSKSNAQHSANYRERLLMKNQADGTHVESTICSESPLVSQPAPGLGRFIDVDVFSVVRLSAFKNVRNVGTPGKKGIQFVGAIVSYDDESGGQVMKAVAEHRFLKKATCYAYLTPSDGIRCSMKSGNVEGITVVYTDSGQYLAVPTSHVAESVQGNRPPTLKPEETQPKLEEILSQFPDFDAGGIIFDDDPKRNALLWDRVLKAASKRKFCVGTLPDVVESLIVPPAKRTEAISLALDREREYIKKKQVEVSRLEKEVKEVMTRAVEAAAEVHARGGLEKIERGSLIPLVSVEGKHVNKVIQILNDIVEKDLMQFDAAGGLISLMQEKYNALETLAGEKLTPLMNHWECTPKEYTDQSPWVIEHDSIVQDLYRLQYSALKKADPRKTCAEDGCVSFVVHPSRSHCSMHQKVDMMCTYSDCDVQATMSGGLCETHFNLLVGLLKKAIVPGGERK